jgi:hypothetical protein
MNNKCLNDIILGYEVDMRGMKICLTKKRKKNIFFFFWNDEESNLQIKK